MIGEKCNIQRAKRNSQTRINTCLDDMFLHAAFTSSGRGENRYFAPGDKMFPGTLDMNRILHDLRREGMVVKREDVATLSPYLTQHIKRFGDYQIDGLNDMTLTEDDAVPPLELDE